MNERLARLKVRLVRLGVPAVLLAGLLAVPLGLAVLGEEKPAQEPGPVVALGRIELVSEPEVLAPRVETPSMSPEVRAARSRVEEIRVMEREELLALARVVSTQERLAAVNVLWARGERVEVEALAAGGDRVMVAKVEALRAKER